MITKLSWKWWSLATVPLLTLVLFPLAWAFPTFPGDERALLELQGLQTEWLDTSARAVSSLGWMPLSIGLVLGVAVSLFLLHRRADALIVALSLLPMLAGYALKTVVDRPRPEYILEAAQSSGLSFPSGHSLYAVIFGGILIVLVGEVIQPPLIRRWLQMGLALLILAVGLSRVYLGAHWPSDVIGGYLFGGVALMGLVMLRRWMHSSR